jgi:outer membrane protein OmpA-like peptidoglycan-associated protein
MRRACCALTVLLCLHAACAEAPSDDGSPRDAETAPPTPADPSPTAATNDRSREAAAAGPLADFAAALGLGSGGSVPEGLVAGGECPPAGGDTAQEIAAQANAAVPLKEGLTLAYMWTRTPQEEYECLIQVTRIGAQAIDTTASCNLPDNNNTPKLRRICRADLRSARMLHTMYGVIKVIGPSGEEEPETITGATAFSLSTEEFAQLKRRGTMTHQYVEFGASGRLQKHGIGELHVEGRETMTVIVNDRPIDLNVIKARGKLKWWIRGNELETEDTLVVLDDERFPLLIDQQSSNESAGSRIRFAKITHPGSGDGDGSLEGGLRDNRSVDVYGIYFDFNSDRIRSESEPVLEEIGAVMLRNPDWQLSIQGHTDNVGGDGDYNLQLSRRRSEAVKAALTARFNVAADRLSTGGMGAAAPKDTNDTPEGRARNRRVELVRH